MTAPVVLDLAPAAALTFDIATGPVPAADISATAPTILDLETIAAAPTAPPAAGSPGDLSLDQSIAAPVVDGVLSLNVAQADTFRIDLAGDVTSVVLTGWPASGLSKRVAIYFVQDAVGSRAVTWPAAWKWSAGVAHALSTDPGAIDCFVFVSIDGGATVFGNVVGLAYA